ncbi:unnamed protein product, partial [Pelagomonas calceolata]
FRARRRLHRGARGDSRVEGGRARRGHLHGDLGVDGGHVAHEVDDAVRVAPLVVVPGDALDELGREHDARPGVEDGRRRLGLEVGRDEGLVAVAEDARHGAVGEARDLGADVVVGRRRVELDREVDDGDVGGRHAEGHARELALDVGDDLGDGLGGARGGRDDVAGGAAAAAPVLVRGRVDDLLGGRHGVDRRHEALLDAELVVDGLDHGREAVGRAGRAGDGDHGRVVGLLVDAHDDRRGVVLGRGREDDLLGAGGDVGRDLVGREEGAGGLADVLGAHRAEGDLGRVARVRRRREDAVDHEAVGRGLDGARVAAVDGVVLELVGHVLVGRARVHELEVDRVRLGHDAGHEAADAAEAVDAAGDGHGRRLGGGLGARGRREGIARRRERGRAGGEEGGGGVLPAWVFGLAVVRGRLFSLPGVCEGSGRAKDIRRRRPAAVGLLMAFLAPRIAGGGTEGLLGPPVAARCTAAPWGASRA